MKVSELNDDLDKAIEKGENYSKSQRSGSWILKYGKHF
jgi:hypothetical protein